MIIRFASRELKFTARQLRLAFFILALGFLGPFLSVSLQTSVAGYLESSSRDILSADLTLNSLRPFTGEDRLQVQGLLKVVRTTDETEFVTMASTSASASVSASVSAASAKQATLVEVEGIDSDFPIFGRFRASAGSNKILASRDLNGHERIAWVFPEVLAELGLHIGDSLKLGDQEFKIFEVLDDAPGASRAGGFAPRVFIGRKFIDDTGLTRYGSQVFYRLYLQLPAGMDSTAAADLLKSGLNDPDIFVRTPDDSVQGFERFFHFFNLYLTTITMIVFVLSWVSAFYCLQIYLQDRLKSAAIFLLNGASRFRVGGLYSLQVIAVVFLALLVAGFAGGVVVLVGNSFFREQMPIGFLLQFSLADAGELAVVALASGVAFITPFFVRLYSLRPLVLLNESALSEERIPIPILLLSYLPLLAIFALLSIWLMDSWLDALRLVGGMILTAGLGLTLGRLLFAAFFRVVRDHPGFLRLVATQLGRSRFGVNLCFLALVLNALVLNLIPHLLHSIVEEVRPLEGKDVPALFLFNIPESNLERVETFASARQIDLRYLSPLVLGRLKKRNGRDVTDDHFQRFPVRLSYRAERISSEHLVAGRDFSGAFAAGSNRLPEISLEEHFAERNGFRLGDRLEFDIQGLPIEAEVVGIRHVRWTTFNPNFFIMFQPGVLDDAPKMWLADVNFSAASADRYAAKKVALQFDLARDFPDISIIDIGRTIDRVLQIARSVIGPVITSAWITVALSLSILIGVVLHNLRMRQSEIDVAKLFGADLSLIRGLIAGEYLATSFLAWLVGSSAAIGIAAFVTRRLLDIELSLSWPTLWLSLFATVGATIAVAFISSDRLLRQRSTQPRIGS